MGKEYTVKQVIFALREEYLKVRKELENLKKYITIDSKIKQSEFYYLNYNGHPDGYNVIISLYLKMNIIQKVISRLTNPNSMPSYYEVYRDSNPNTISFENIPYVTINDKEGLLKACQALVENEFVKNINLLGPYKVLNQNSPLAILGNNERGINTDYCTPLDIGYRMDYDRLEVTGSNLKNRFVVTPDIIYNLLNLKVNNTNFNDYYKKVIENYQDKPILVNGSQIIKYSGEYQILDEQERLVLIPKNK